MSRETRQSAETPEETTPTLCQLYSCLPPAEIRSQSISGSVTSPNSREQEWPLQRGWGDGDNGVLSGDRCFEALSQDERTLLFKRRKG